MYVIVDKKNYVLRVSSGFFFLWIEKMKEPGDSFWLFVISPRHTCDSFWLFIAMPNKYLLQNLPMIVSVAHDCMVAITLV